MTTIAFMHGPYDGAVASYKLPYPSDFLQVQSGNWYRRTDRTINGALVYQHIGKRTPENMTVTFEAGLGIEGIAPEPKDEESRRDSSRPA